MTRSESRVSECLAYPHHLSQTGPSQMRDALCPESAGSGRTPPFPPTGHDVIGRGIRMALALSALVPAVSAAQGHPRPGADVVNDLRRHHHAGDWWRITTDDARYEARVVEIDAEGLASVTVARRAPPAPERIAWSAFVRIDLRKSHATRGAIQGMLLGMGAGFIPFANGNANSKQPGTYMLGGALAGYLVGGMLGGADVHERPLYVAPAPPAAPATPIVASRATSRAETGAFVQPGDSAIAAAPDSAAM